MLTKTITRVEESSKQEKQQVPVESALLNRLKEVRRVIAQKENVPAYIILSDATLVELASYLPANAIEIRKISGFGDVKVERYASFFLKEITTYCKESNLTSRISAKIPKRERRGAEEKVSDTKLVTLQLFKLGNSVAEIAKNRNLAVSTIETHLAHFVFEGQLSISKLVAAEKIPEILNAIKVHGDQSLGVLKEVLGENATYGEIRAVVNDQRRITAG